jgi:Protein-tyrosine phosphatase
LGRYSDGGGRSGVFLAIDANLESSEEDGVYEVYGYLKKLRAARRGLVETIVRPFPNIQMFHIVTQSLESVAGTIQIHLRHAGRGAAVRIHLVPRLRAVGQTQAKIHPQSGLQDERIPA